jgi:Do/DeqQ family serine protease
LVKKDTDTGGDSSMDPNYSNPQPARPRRRHRKGLAGAGAAALLLTGSLLGWSAADLGTASASAPSAATAAADPAKAAPGSYATVVDQVGPAVVTIRSERRVRNVSGSLPGDPRLREFFEGFGFGGPGDPRGGPRMPERRQGGLGSGVIVRADGYILTNQHVIADASAVTVELTDGRRFKAKVVGSDEPSDLAVLKIDGTALHTLPLGNSDDVRVGDVVLAVGNPLGVGQTVTMGIVSAKGRATGGAGDGSFEDFIQTDAPINQGNSGGALVSTRGELVGINSQILSPSGGNIGIGFAIPANMAAHVMSQLIEHGEVRRGMLGVSIQPVTADIARSLGLSEVRGAIVSAVNEGSPAAKAGLERGDVITAVNGEAVRDGNSLRNQIAQLLPGTAVKLAVVRDGRERTLAVTLAALQGSRDGASVQDGEGSDGTGFGMSVEPLTRDRARQLGVDATRGLVVAGVQPSGKAADAGLRQGDVIAEVDGAPVTSVDELRAALKDGTRPALLLVHRGPVTVFVTVER